MPSPRSSKAPSVKPSVPPTASPSLIRLAVTAALLLFVFICYWPLTRYFLAQDDFILLEHGSRGLREAMSSSFSLRPGQFRPITKGLYFMLAWPAFGLNALPYHIVSLLLHTLNAVLVGVVLRRLGISRVVSWLGAFVFAAHLCHIEAIAWASCVQQLLGGVFLFSALACALDAMEGRGRRRVLGATVAYALALGSYEQALAAPFVLVAWAWLRHGLRAAFRAAWGPLRAMFIVFAVYGVYSFILRGMPETGPYVMSVGRNVIDNLIDYTGLAFSLWHVYPAYGLLSTYGRELVAWFGVIILHLVLRSHRELLFGLIMFFALLAPVMFTTAHTHSFHLYLPAIGVCYLLASAAESIRRVAATHRSAITLAMVAVTAVVAAGSAVAVRKNTKAVISQDVPLPRLFVLRRAILAERMCEDIVSKRTVALPRLILAYPNPALTANWRNVQTAVGKGSAVRLALNEPDLNVVFVPPDSMPVTNDPREVMVFVEWGRCFTYPEWEAVQKELESRGP